MLRPYYEDIINYLLKGTFWKAATDADRNVIRKRSSKYKVINGVLYHKGKGRGIEDLRLVATTVPDQQNAIRMCHISETGDQHFGVNTTASLLASRFYWRMMYTDVMKYTENCQKCNPERPVVVPDRPVTPDERLWVWRMLEVEIIENFQVNGRKVYHLLRLVDVHSNWTTFSFLEDTTERTTVRTLFRECSALGFPLSFRFVRHNEKDNSWTNHFISALHQELDGFSSICGQEVDTSVHVVIEETDADWQPDQCLQNCQQMILDRPAALYVFFGSKSLIDKEVHEWYINQMQQFVKKEPFWWPQRLSSFVFHLRNCLPPGMTSSPSSVLLSGERCESHLFLPMAPEKESEEKAIEPLVALPPRKELLARSYFRTAEESVEKSKGSGTHNGDTSGAITTSTRSSSKESVEKPPVEIRGRRKTEPTRIHSRGSNNKRNYQTSKPSHSEDLPARTEEQQRKVDANIKEALEITISKGLKDVKRQMKRRRKHGKRNDEDLDADMFNVPAPVVLPPGLDMAMSSNMSSLEALKAVTGSALPQSVPPSPLLPSAILSPTTPEDNSPAPPQEEASPGRYSFRQNLKPKGTSNFIRRLIAKTSSKRFTGIQSPEDFSSPLAPPKRSRRMLQAKYRPAHAPLPSILQTEPSALNSTPVQNSLPVLKPFEHVLPIVPTVDANLKDLDDSGSFLHSPQHLQLSASSAESNASHSLLKKTDSTLDDEFESNCNLALSKAEEELIDQTIKGVIDTEKMVGVDVLTVEDISKDDLSSMEVSDSDVAVPLNAGDIMNHSSEAGRENSLNDVLGSDRMENSEGVLKTVVFNEEESICNSRLSSELVSGDLLSHVTEEQNVFVDCSEKDVLHDAEHDDLHIQNADCDMVDVSKDVSSCADIVHDLNQIEDIGAPGEPVACTSVVNSDVIFDVLDTCATFEVGEKEEFVSEVSENMEDNELELMKEKISQDLANGLTVDKTKSAEMQQRIDLDNADTDEYSIMASACDALLNMAAATNFAPSVNNQNDMNECSGEGAPLVPDLDPSVNTTTLTKTDSPEICAIPTPLQKPSCMSLVETAVTKSPASIEDSHTESTVDVKPESGIEDEDESELCLPSDLFIDEEALVECSAKLCSEKESERPAVPPKLANDQDIGSILNSIMSNRAFMDDPVTHAQREKEDNEFKALYGLTKDIRIKVKAIAELVVQRAMLGPVPVRTIRNIDRRAYYVGNIKIDEFKTPVVQGPHTGGTISVPAAGVKKARVHIPKLPPVHSIRNLQSVLKPPASPKETNSSDGGGSGRSTPLGQSAVKKSSKPFGCPICPRIYAISQEMLDLHIAFHIDNARNLHCPVCGKAGANWMNILRHYLSHPEIKNDASLYEMILATCDRDRKVCGQCNTLFAMRNALIHHLQSSHIGEKVNGSTKAHLLDPLNVKDVLSETPSIQINSPEVKDVNYLCPNCPYSTKTHYNLILHSHECQGNVQKLGDSFTKILDDLTPQFKCSLCGYCGVSSKQLEQHMRLQHTNSTPSKMAARTMESKYTCEYCLLKFKTNNQLQYHHLLHKEANMFVCRACNYKCRYKKIMHRHAKKVHPSIPLKGLIKGPKKWKGLPSNVTGQQNKLPKETDRRENDEDTTKDGELDDDDQDPGIPTATVVVHTDENGELTVCDEEEVSTIPLEPEQTTFLLDSSTLDRGTVTLDGNAVTLDGTSVTLDGNMLQILQNDGGDCNGQPKVLLLSVGPTELDSFSSNTFTLPQENSSS